MTTETPRESRVDSLSLIEAPRADGTTTIIASGFLGEGGLKALNEAIRRAAARFGRGSKHEHPEHPT